MARVVVDAYGVFVELYVWGEGEFGCYVGGCKYGCLCGVALFVFNLDDV